MHGAGWSSGDDSDDDGSLDDALDTKQVSGDGRLAKFFHPSSGN
jgi:hypothetical protein